MWRLAFDPIQTSSVSGDVRPATRHAALSVETAPDFLENPLRDPGFEHDCRLGHDPYERAPLAPARGLLLGVVFGAVVWMTCGTLAFLVF